MVESTFSTSENAQSASARATRSLPIADDDDEPPSSGPKQNGHPQITPHHSSDDNSSQIPPVKVRDTFDPESEPEEKIDIEQGDPKNGHAVYGHAATTTTLADEDKVEVNRGADLPRRRSRIRPKKPWYMRFALSKKSRLRTLFTPTHELGPRPTYMESVKAALFYSYLNILLAFIPVSWAMYYTDQNPTLIFVFSCLAIIPLAALLGLGTEQIALRTSQSVGGLLNATLGNVVEMIIGAIALKKCELELTQSSLLGGLLSNLLLVLGCAFLVGGYRFQQSEFQASVAQLNSSLLIVAVISFFIPTAFHVYLEDRLEDGTELDFLLRLSHGSAVIMLVVYLAYLYFQFYSHNHLFLDMDAQSSGSSSSSSNSSIRTNRSTRSNLNFNGHGHSAVMLEVPADPNPLFGSRISLASALESHTQPSDIEYLKLNLPSALGLLGIVTALVYFTADHLVASLEGLIANNPSVSKKWITLIVIPIVGNAAEYATAVLVASKGKFNLSMSVAVGSCIQIAFFVIPILVLVAWGIGKPLTLLFDPLETFVLFFSVLVVKFTVEDGKSHWLNGLALISVYTLIALSFWGFPDTPRLIQGQPLPCF
ncbi:calcium ion transporter [Coprinopsis marcescibilis]|uniref:Calcium ion transporter n=1 Tax=Coprinopsis marcescibilis TaxID=230819 RepID=A0A5C3KZC9_COPMA|nr:calcium ion transporter [Coprinopsis marcescibilis]